MTSPGDRIRVLHVDDDPDLGDLVATFLEREDDRFDVRTAQSPDVGLEHLAESDVDCIVSDYDMPHTSGIDFLEAVRSDHPDLPFILYTGKGSEEVASEAISSGVTDYLQKESGTSQYAVLANRISNAVEQYRSRQAIEETEQKLTELAERTDDVLFMVDGDWQELLFVNSAYEEIWGGSIETLEDHPQAFLEHVHPEDEEKARASMAELKAGEPSRVQYRLVRPDGERRWVRGDTQPIFDEAGNVDRIVGQVRDVTEQKERELRLETIIDNLPGYVYRHRNEPEYPLQFVKGDAETITGYTATELEDEVVLAEEIIHPDDREELWENHIESIETSGQFDATYRIVTKSGEVRWIRDQGQLIEDPVSGEEIVDGFITDVSEQIQRESELRRKQTFIDESLDALQDLYYVISEDEELVRWNRRVSEVTGYTDDEIAEMDLARFFAETDRERILESIRETIESGSSAVKADVRTADGERIPHEFRTKRLHNPIKGEVAVAGVGRDISDQKQREAKLERYRQIVEDLEDIATIIDPDGTIKYVSPTVERVLGYEPEELIGTDAFEPVPQETREKVADATERVLASPEQTQTFQTQFRRADGSICWIESTLRNRLDDPKIDGILVSSREITERVQQRRELERTTDLFEQAQEIANVGAWETDLRSGEGWWTEEVNRIYGLPAGYEPGAGEGIEYFHPDDRPIIREAFERAKTAGESYDLELRVQRDDGRVRWVRAKGEPQIEDGEVVRVRGTLQDISERKERERALGQIQQRTQKLMQTTTKEETAQAAVDTARDVVGAELSGCHVLDSNRQTLEPIAFMDTVREKLGDPPAYDRTADDDPASQVVWRAFERGEPLVIEDTREYGRLADVTPARSAIIHPLGEYGVFIVSATEPDAFDETKKVSTEIVATALSAAFARVEREQKLRRQNDRLDKFASVVSHDLRNPLNVATARLELARRECDSEHLRELARAHDRMETLIEDLLTLTREGERVDEVEPIALPEMTDDCWQTVATADATVVAETGQTIRADPGRLKRLLENLFRNAVEHAGEDVTVTVGSLDGGFYVADDGPGIPEADREQVFDAGYSTADRGTGFGLNIVEEIVEAHGWDVRLTASESGGARFEITGVEIAAK